MNDYESIMSRTVVTGPDDCWLWTRSVGQAGHPHGSVNGKHGSIRRALWAFLHPDQPLDKAQVSNTCKTALCLNPAHFVLRPWHDDEARFWTFVEKTDGCWLWTGAKFRNGYGAFRMKGKIRHAARVSWEIANGPIEGHDPSRNETCIVIQHRCDNPPCVRPEHLELGTYLSNTRDMIAKGRAGWQKKRAAAGELNTCKESEGDRG